MNVTMNDETMMYDETLRFKVDCFFNALDAVSYTHLDVYKRQVHMCVCGV